MSSRAVLSLAAVLAARRWGGRIKADHCQACPYDETSHGRYHITVLETPASPSPPALNHCFEGNNVSDQQSRQAFFRPDVYEVENLEQARNVIVTPEKGTTTDERWEKETDYLVDEIGHHLAIEDANCVLDYGCGIGRLSKAMIDRFGCRVIGVDASKGMRDLAPQYVLSERFAVWSPEVLGKMAAKGFRFSKAICLWVLQHVLNPADTLQLIDGSLSADAHMYVLNQDSRCVPTNLGYVNDGQDVAVLLQSRFEQLERSRLPLEVTTQIIAQHASVFVLRKKRAEP